MQFGNENGDLKCPSFGHESFRSTYICPRLIPDFLLKQAPVTPPGRSGVAGDLDQNPSNGQNSVDIG